MLELARRVEGIDVDLDRTGPDDSEERDGKRRHIRRHHRDAVSLAHAKSRLQPGSEGGRQAVNFAIGQLLSRRAEGGALGVDAHRLVEQIRDGLMALHIDVRIHAELTISLEPWS
jgi:hypothetical protein